MLQHVAVDDAAGRITINRIAPTDKKVAWLKSPRAEGSHLSGIERFRATRKPNIALSLCQIIVAHLRQAVEIEGVISDRPLSAPHNNHNSRGHVLLDL
jgi:hypothetical protein